VGVSYQRGTPAPLAEGARRARNAATRCRANMAHVRHSRPDAGLFKARCWPSQSQIMALALRQKSSNPFKLSSLRSRAAPYTLFHLRSEAGPERPTRTQLVTHPPTHSLTHSHTRVHTHTHSHSYTHTHTHTHTHSHTLCGRSWRRRTCTSACTGARRRSTRVERTWHIEDSQGQILASIFRQKSLKPLKVSSLRTEAGPNRPTRTQKNEI
jgi:hypothetical protein